MRRLSLGVLAAAAVFVPSVASAQARMCAVPQQLSRPRPDLPSAREPRRVLPIGGYTLALTWSPGYCRVNARDAEARFQCRSGNRFGFTLHGLWPDGYGAQWPQYCSSTGLVPAAVVRETLCATPSTQLIQHEWAKHGTCTALSMRDYFATARRLYGGLHYPDMDALSRRQLTVAQFRAAFAAANPGVPAEAVRVTTTRDWLDEIWLCLDTRMRYARCRPDSGGAPASARLRIWR
ncbi:MAG: ribonuclease T [Sphingomonas sp.]|uniref:ribonuclease T2 family protein n=1 Tax=Sphingomonas sp. TaxID=28214 RepID=UPI001B1CD2C7|nr:ribonuclease T [Sphingomonas sp.]MBO9622575.1 ribonuclease T [Sphingomonas sp.]